VRYISQPNTGVAPKCNVSNKQFSLTRSLTDSSQTFGQFHNISSQMLKSIPWNFHVLQTSDHPIKHMDARKLWWGSIYIIKAHLRDWGIWGANADTKRTRKASTHKSALTNASTVFGNHDFGNSWLWVMSPKNYWPPKNGFPGLIVGHLYVKLGDPICISFLDIVSIYRQTDKHIMWTNRQMFVCSLRAGVQPTLDPSTETF